MNISININEDGKTVRVQVGGELDAYTAPKLREELFPLTEKEEVNMVIDLSKVSYLDSTGLGVFVGVFKNVRSNNGKFKITGLSDRLMKLFEITGLANIIDLETQLEGEAN
jgi:anti-sigma B factor antagonist